MNSTLRNTSRILKSKVKCRYSRKVNWISSAHLSTQKRPLQPIYAQHRHHRIPSLYISTRLIQMPQFPRPPNKYELLNQARGFIQRLKVRIKYPLMKQMRPFNLNDISAVISWVFLGHTAWLVLGTTSFISFGLWAANSLQFQG